MILEFATGVKIEVQNIFGSSQLIFGSMRDTLTIEVSPQTITFERLKQLFEYNIDGTSILYSQTDEERCEIGKGYSIFVSITDEYRMKQKEPGCLIPDELEEVYIVKIAQMTYAEYQLLLLKSSPK